MQNNDSSIDNMWEAFLCGSTLLAVLFCLERLNDIQVQLVRNKQTLETVLKSFSQERATVAAAPQQPSWPPLRIMLSGGVEAVIEDSDYESEDESEDGSVGSFVDESVGGEPTSRISEAGSEATEAEVMEAEAEATDAEATDAEATDAESVEAGSETVEVGSETRSETRSEIVDSVDSVESVKLAESAETGLEGSFEQSFEVLT